MLMACLFSHLSVCKWLVLAGALNRPGTLKNRTDDDTNEGQLAGHVDAAVVRRETLPPSGCPVQSHRPELLEWAQDVVATHHTFLHVVLRASVILSHSYHQVSPDQRCHLPRLPRVVLERLGDMLGVEMGRRVRNVREFAEALAAVVAEEGESEESEDEENSEEYDY